MEIRRATPEDYAAVREMTADLWDDRGGDYLPEVYHEWLESPEETGRRTFLAELDGQAVGIVQALVLSPEEAWFQSMRVHPDARRQGVSARLNETCFAWARERGARVGRVMIFSWNPASMAAARANGFDPVTVCRFAQPTPDADASGPAGYTVSSDADAAWECWLESDARGALAGLALAPESPWSLRELTRTDLTKAGVLTVERDGETRAMAWRVRETEREDDGESTTTVEYGAAAWTDEESARALFAAIARDAADRGGDEIRVLLPETATALVDAAYGGCELAEEAMVVLENPLDA
ncbi:GNAT family N-acetyltransferase [Natronobiforma cellulositropha]|uniref:GNAT family N-acetyltransferase n=1 Tax=Natronobiforma cellulositropha TaxID=1679076 RepID=UPI0021D5E40B|nr:GNAT family N-acetyltransferase [Natronobiforma cellulositropha]